MPVPQSHPSRIQAWICRFSCLGQKWDRWCFYCTTECSCFWSVRAIIVFLRWCFGFWAIRWLPRQSFLPDRWWEFLCLGYRKAERLGILSLDIFPWIVGSCCRRSSRCGLFYRSIEAACYILARNFCSGRTKSRIDYSRRVKFDQPSIITLQHFLFKVFVCQLDDWAGMSTVLRCVLGFWFGVGSSWRGRFLVLSCLHEGGKLFKAKFGEFCLSKFTLIRFAILGFITTCEYVSWCFFDFECGDQFLIDFSHLYDALKHEG